MRGLNGPYLFILITLMIDAIGIGIVFPIMPDLMERVGAGGTAEGSVRAGILMAAYAAAQFLFAPRTDVGAHAALHEAAGDHGANASGAPGDDGDFARQVEEIIHR